jgi:hypothetical protein
VLYETWFNGLLKLPKTANYTDLNTKGSPGRFSLQFLHKKGHPKLLCVPSDIKGEALTKNAAELTKLQSEIQDRKCKIQN